MVARTEANEAIAGIADQWHACVADKGDFGALLHGDNELGGASHFIVFVVRDKRLLDFVMGKELLRVASVFAGDLVGFFEDSESAKSDVLKIADGSADEVEAAARIFEFR